MISDNNKFVFLKVPVKWTEIYNKLLILMSNRGIDMIKDCNASCDGETKKLIECWNQFNAACAAYAIGQETEAKILIRILIDCMNKKYKTNYDEEYYTDFNIDNLSYINCNNSTFFIDEIINLYNADNFNDFSINNSLNNAEKLKDKIDEIINGFKQEYEDKTYNNKNAKYITGNEYLITEDVINDDLFIIRISKSYKLNKISYNSIIGENIIYDLDKNINNNLYIFENISYDYNLYIYYNNDKTYEKNVKIELIK